MVYSKPKSVVNRAAMLETVPYIDVHTGTSSVSTSRRGRGWNELVATEWLTDW